MENITTKQIKIYWKIFEEKYLYLAAILGAVIVLVIIGSLVFLSPTWAEKNNLKQNIDSKKITYTAKQQELVQLEEIKKNYIQSKSEVDKVSKVLPSEKEIPEVLAQLESINKKTVLNTNTPLVFKSFSVGASASQKESESKTENSTASDKTSSEEESQGETIEYTTINEGGYLSLPISVQLIGSFNALEYYLESLEKNLRLIDVIAINISGSAQGANNLSFTVNMKTYFQPASDSSTPAFISE